jgi:hypothetical protein
MPDPSPAILPFGGPAAWKGPALDWEKEALWRLGDAELAELDAALAALKGRGGDPDFPGITAERFALPTLGRRLARLKDSLRFGRGFALLRGIDPGRWPLDDLARVYAGLGAHLGVAQPQSWQGELLGHVIDVSDIETAPRGYHAGGRQNMHTDSCDVVALMCIRAAKSGGKSRIASAVAVHDALLARRPELAARQYRGFRLRRNDKDAEHGSGMVVSAREIPLWMRGPDGLCSYQMAYYARNAAARGDTTMDAPGEEALTEVERLASSPEFHLDMAIGEGDIQFLNNRVIVHGRNDFEDWPELARRRHLMRLWLRVPDWPPLPEAQVFHTDEDRRLWLRQRRPRMELPSVYFAEMDRRRAERAAAAE